MPKGIYTRSFRPLAERFWEKVDVRGPDECWPWMGGTDRAGYGRIGDRGNIILFAHRVCWTLCFGPIPEGINVCHTCDNPPCCNPRCLFLGTQAENLKDMVIKGRWRHGHLYGEAHPSAKLTANQVIEIRSASGLQREIAAGFGITQVQVSAIRRGASWRTPKSVPLLGKSTVAGAAA